MDKKEEFKKFAKSHPKLVSYVKNGEMSWQKFYEIYDIYGEDKTAWESYLVDDVKEEPVSDNLNEKVKGIDLNSIQEHIKTAQKALDLVSELTTKDVKNITNIIPKVPRPLNKFFED